MSSTSSASSSDDDVQTLNDQTSLECPETRQAITESSALLPKQESPVSGIAGIISILLLGVFVSNADGSLVLATYGLISSEFRDLTGSGWIITSYLIAGCATQALYGKLSDIFGRKNMLLVAYTLFISGLAVCGWSYTLWQFVVGRVVSGCGGAGMTVLVSIIISDLVPVKEIAIWRSYVNIAATIGRSLGGPIGGFLADTIGWRWSFFAQCPLALVAIISVLLKYKPLKLERQESAREKLARVDFVGSIAMTTTIIALLILLESLNESTWSIIAIYSVGTLISATLFVLIESKVKEPVFPPRLLIKRPVGTAYLVGIFQLAAQLGMMFAVPIYFQITKNVSTTNAGAHLFPAVAGNAIGGILTGIYIKWTGRYKAATILAAIVSSISYTLLLLRWRGDTNLWESLYIIPGGFGTGIALSSTFIALSAGVDKSEIAVAGAGLYMTNNFGGILGLTAVTVVLKKVLVVTLESSLTSFPNKDKIISKALSSLTYVHELEGELHDLVVDGYVKALEATHCNVVSLLCSCLALVAALCMRQVKIT